MATNVVLQTKESRDLLTTNYSSAVATGTAFRVSASPTDNYSFELVPSGTDASAVIKIEGSIKSSTGPFTQIGVSMTPSTTEASTTLNQFVVDTPQKWLRGRISTAGTTQNSTGLILRGWF